MTVEELKTVFDWTALILGFLTVVAGVGILITGNIINKRQAGQIEQFDKDLRDKDVKIAEAQQEAGAANDRAGAAVERASKADERAAMNEKEAARLTKEAEDERMARVQLAASISWRAPDRSLVGELARPLKPFAGQRYTIVSDPGEPERLSVVSWIVLLLGDATWALEANPPSFKSEVSFIATNIVLWVSPTAPDKVLSATRALVPAMERGGLPTVVLQSGWGPQPDAAPPELIRVVIFKKGPRMTVTGNAITFEESPSSISFGHGPPH